jgi:hypothetical protein
MHPAFANAVEMLCVPRARLLTEPYLDGKVCVWCGQEPTLDLGPRLSAVCGKLVPWRPQSCLDCAADEAARVHRIHLRVCARCTPFLYCPDSRALHALATKTPAPGAGRPGVG